MRTDSEQERSFVLALDEGTTNTKAMLVDLRNGTIAASASARLSIAYPSPGHVEQDASEILETTLAVAAKCLEGINPQDVFGISISNQRETVVAWNAKTGEPIGPALGWQDARTTQLCEQLRPISGEIRARTGLVLDPMFSAPKMRYLLDFAATEGVPAEEIRLGTIDTWLLYSLTGSFLAEAGNASRTLLMKLSTLEWDPFLLDAFGIPESSLAPISRSDADFGQTREGLPIPVGIPVISVLADSHAALFFHTLGEPGLAKATYGTGSSIMAASPVPVAPEGVTGTLAWLSEAPTFAREGNILTSGATFTWVADMLTDGNVKEIDRLASEIEETNLTLVPAFSGLGAPYFDRNAQGLISGISGGSTRQDLARAALEAVANQVTDVVLAMEQDGLVEIDKVRADGGPTASQPLMQLQADFLAKPVEIATRPEASCLGAALFGARAHLGPEMVEGWKQQRAAAKTYVPVMPGHVRQKERSKWASAVERSMFIPSGADTP